MSDLAAFSAIMIVGAFVFPEVIRGITEASAIPWSFIGRRRPVAARSCSARLETATAADLLGARLPQLRLEVMDTIGFGDLHGHRHPFELHEVLVRRRSPRRAEQAVEQVAEVGEEPAARVFIEQGAGGVAVRGHPGA